jgi:acetyl-CoA C-acetyltransferase
MTTTHGNQWLVAGVRTPFVRVDGPFAHHDSLALSVPVAQAMGGQVRGPIDLGVWGPVVLNLAYNNFAREVWLEAKLDPHVPTFTTMMQCSTSMAAVRAIVSICADGGQGTVALLEN